MKILLSAYACEPNRGSEPGVGWNWAIELAQLNYDVWVLTRKNNKQVIESELKKQSENNHLHFIYYDLPKWAKWWKKGGRGVRLYYFFWQGGAYLLAKKVHKIEQFDRVHHVTFVSVRQPSFMGNLGIPFIFGPVAGGETAPWKLRHGYNLRGWLLDAIRDGLNALIKFDPFMWMTFSQADKIYVTSEQTRALLPKKFFNKAKVQLAIGFNGQIGKSSMAMQDKINYKILFVGQFIYLKGMHLGLPAFSELLKKIPSATLTLISGGPEQSNWENLARDLNIYDQIEWLDRVEQSKLKNYYSTYDVFLFPSLHDSGGMVVLEAMAHGMPVVCLDLGGPGIIVNDNNGLAVSTDKKSESEVISGLTNALFSIFNNDNYRYKLGQQALVTASSFSWKRLVSKIYLEQGKDI